MTKRSVALLMVILYPVGLPVCYLYLLYKNRVDIQHRIQFENILAATLVRRRGSSNRRRRLRPVYPAENFINGFSFLFEAYHPD